MNHNSSFIFSSEAGQAQHLFRRLALFALPFLTGLAFIVIIDPFDFIGVSQVVPEEVKYRTAGQLNPTFWQLNRFSKMPKENILLGDSRMQGLDVAEIQRVSGADFANLAYGGGSLREAFDTFRIADKQIKLKQVYLGVNLNNFNDYEIANRTEFYRAAHENPALYFINRTVWEAAGYCFYQTATGKNQKIGVPNMNRDEFWNEELGIMQKYYDKYLEPVKYRKELLEVGEYCRKNNIKLSFIVFPTHTDAQKLVTNSGLDAKNAEMKSFLATLGKVYDFEGDTDLTVNKEHFDDPVHLTKESRKLLIEEIWKDDVKYESVK